MLAASLCVAATIAFAVPFASRAYNVQATGYYLRTDVYGTQFYAHGEVEWSPINPTNIYVWRNWISLQVVGSGSLNCDANQVYSDGYADRKNWYNAPFPITSSSGVQWDYFTWNRNFGGYYNDFFGASVNEQCNLSRPQVPPGIQEDTVNGGASWSWGVY